MFTASCGPRYGEADAFPARLRADVNEVVALISKGELCRPRYFFNVMLDGEALHVPSRLYYDSALLRQTLSVSGGVHKLIVRKFARENLAYLATLERRVTSYWSCYHRQAYPDRDDYPGTIVVAHIKAVS
jgi:hypothetical protein